MINELLLTGKNNTITARQLAEILGCDIRNVTLQIERERRSGFPICATNSINPGYYLAESRQQLEAYIGSLTRRTNEITQTKKALEKILPKLS